ncbi:hypothetical protein [Piscinibacter sp.]|jgi:hypothetical protein|uniref:hypothetical protein n=1 Tax=Piscinibacter sp. TaxID=1903157 RepID=UPI00355A7366
MNEGFIADLKMLQPEGGSEPDQLVRRQKEMLLDLYRLVPRLASLSRSELRARWIARSETWWLRLELVPRRQGLLFDSLASGRSRPASLHDEAQLVRKDLGDSPLRARQAAAGLKKWAASSVPAPLDPGHELAYRRSRTQWIFESESGQLCLMFAEAPRYKVDPKPCQVSGTVASVSLRAIELRQVYSGLEDQSPANLDQRGFLRVIPCAIGEGKLRAVPWQLAQQVRPGEIVSVNVTLHRCLLSNQVIGAVVAEV